MTHDADPSPAPRPSGPPRFQGRSAVITGAARDMGRAHAIGLAREGCDLVVCDICEGLPDGTPYPKSTEAELEETVRLCEAEGVRCLARKMDVADPVKAVEPIGLAMEEFGRLDFLIANAALTIEAAICDTPPYVSSKWGLVGLAKTAALEVAKKGITVNVILPGPVETPMMSSEERFRQFVPGKENPGRDDYLEARKDATPMGYAWVKAEDVTATVLFLLSDEARFISGGTLSVDAADSANWT